MKGKSKILVYILVFLITAINFPLWTFAQKGNNGYEGGIAAGNHEGKNPVVYKEVTFITGEPLVLEGTLIINKTKKQDTINATYTYNLKNNEKNATLTRTLVFSINISKTGDNQEQEVEKISFARTPTEILRIGNESYILRNYEFDFSGLTHLQPAINYNSGSIWSKKTYQVGNANDGKFVTQEITGNVFGYNQYWGNTETASLDYVINWEKPESYWGGNATVNYSTSVTNELIFMENIPEQISFKGGYIQIKNNTSILTYNCNLPELDSNNEPTYRMIETQDSLRIDAFPVKTSLPVPELSHLRGHWDEEEIKKLYSLQIFKNNGKNLNPENYISRAEFISAVMEIIKEVPEDPDLVGKVNRVVEKRVSTSTRRRGVAEEEDEEKTIFVDVPKEHPYHLQIENAYKKSIISGKGKEQFAPEDNISTAEAVVIFIRALGLENLAPNPYAITSFTDDDEIPDYARNAIYAASKIELVRGDERGYLRPNAKMTIGEAASLLNRFIEYMCQGIQNNYFKETLYAR